MALDELNTLEGDLFLIESVLAVVVQIHIFPFIAGFSTNTAIQLVTLILMAGFTTIIFTEFGYFIAIPCLYMLRKNLDFLEKYEDSLNMDNIILPVTAILTPVYIASIHSQLFLGSSLPVLAADILMTVSIFVGAKVSVSWIHSSLFV